MKHLFLFLLLSSLFIDNLNAQNSICQPQIFKDFNPGLFLRSNGLVFFSRDFSAPGIGVYSELWRSDGTYGSGTFKINTAPSPSGYYSFGVSFNGFTYFSTLSPVQLWRTDGTDAGTTLVKEIPDVNKIFELTATNNQLFFLVEGSNTINKLWKTDGTTNGTELVLDIDPTNSSSFEPIRMCALSNEVFFNAGSQSHGVEIWKSNGTAAGTQPVKEIGLGPQDGTSIITNNFMGVLNGNVYFYGGAINSGQQGLWQTDGTSQGTSFVKAIGSFSKSKQIGNLLYFLAYDEGAMNGGSLYGEELWVTDGTASGTYMVKDIRPGTENSFSSNSNIYDFNGKALFAINDGTHGIEPWISDGTEAGTLMIKDINPNQSSSITNLEFSEAINGYAYFSANDAIHGMEMWLTDGTFQGTFLVSDIVPGIDGSGPSRFKGLNNYLLFTALAQGAIHGSIWSCGNLAGTSDVQKQEFEIYPNPSSGILHIDNTPKGCRIKLINTLGQVLVNLESADDNTSLDVSRFANGLYTIILEADGAIVTRKIVVEK
jgi:ELWxxDGT repeat protein